MNEIRTKYRYAVIATDVAIFTVQDDQLKVLLIKMKKEPYTGMWALPGGLVKPKESVEDGAERVLREKTGVKRAYLEQLATFGRVDRDPFGRVVSVAYLALIPSRRLKLRTTKEYGDIAWWLVNDMPELAYDHEEMFSVALEQLKSRLEYSNIAFSLLPREFGLTDLQHLYEVILDQEIDKRNFRKRVLQGNLLKSTGRKRKGEANRPAELYRFVSRNSQTVKVL